MTSQLLSLELRTCRPRAVVRPRQDPEPNEGGHSPLSNTTVWRGDWRQPIPSCQPAE